MSTQNPTPQDIQDATDEIERCLWRANECEQGRNRDRDLEDLDCEVISVLSGLDHDRQLEVMHAIVAHLEKLEGMPGELIDEMFAHSQVSRQQLDSWRLEKGTAAAAAKPAARRI